MGHSGPPVDSQPRGRAPKTREHTSRAGEIPTGRGGRAPPFLKRGPEGPVRHQSRRGDLPGREEVWVGFQQLRSAAFHLPHSTTGPPWPADRRANVLWSESEPGGTHIVCGGPCAFLSTLAARYAAIRSDVTPVVLTLANRCRPPTPPTPTPVPFHSSAHRPVTARLCAPLPTPVDGPRRRYMAMWRG
ncbi:hypothetical protein BO83DRAFT_404471 [Aspergillus eucalypticola CBS 122712]|uniref:Uncharacterized protein n=1 Tax=Aspergillus eucalypticola (strain CBS 122712 / IBT 29274) TaxID=1448314 RepID=A0A317UIE6_ASPEC|nr:hypothetical protein BO83DRAFT_404475 [Aspergillus eucalypticola CBS 122712]PWY61472.1 hypothetical protein BO83DRAFT_404471 [Aspergillus eucalypticola CBS 122712]